MEAYKSGIPNNPQNSAVAPAVVSVNTAMALTTEKIVRTIPKAKGIAIAKFFKKNRMTPTFWFAVLQFPIAFLQWLPVRY